MNETQTKKRQSPSFWVGMIALTFAAIVSATSSRSFSEFKDPLNLLVLAAIGLIFFACAEFILSILEWHYIDPPKKAAQAQQPKKTIVQQPSGTVGLTAVDSTAVEFAEEDELLPPTRFEKRFVIDYNEDKETARIRIYNRVVTVAYAQLDHLSDIFEARTAGKLDTVSARKIGKVTKLNRLSKEVSDLIELLFVNGLIDKSGQAYVWTREGAAVFPPALAHNSGVRGSGGHSTATTSDNQPPPARTTLATSIGH